MCQGPAPLLRLVARRIAPAPSVLALQLGEKKGQSTRRPPASFVSRTAICRLSLSCYKPPRCLQLVPLPPVWGNDRLCVEHTSAKTDLGSPLSGIIRIGTPTTPPARHWRRRRNYTFCLQSTFATFNMMTNSRDANGRSLSAKDRELPKQDDLVEYNFAVAGQ